MGFLPGVDPLPPPVDPLSFVLDIVGFILRLFGIGGVNLDAMTKSINTSWTNLVFTTTFLNNALRSFWDFMRKLAMTIIDGLTHIISDILHGHLLQALKDIQALFHALHDLFKPILDFLQKLHDWFYKYVYKWIRLVQDILSTIRVILSIFQFLGAKWAAKLDADIQKIQSFLTTGLQLITGTLNQVSTWLNFALNPFGLISNAVWKGTAFTSLTTQIRSTVFGQNRALSASEQQNVVDDRNMIAGGAAILTRNQDGSVTYSAASQRVNSGYDSGWQAYGGTTAVH